MANLRLVSDGTPKLPGQLGGTRIVDIDTGETIERVKSFKYEWSHRQYARLTVEVLVDSYRPLGEGSTISDAESSLPTQTLVSENLEPGMQRGL